MLALLDLQHAMRRGILHGDDADIAACVVADGIAAEARVGIYRNSVIAGLTKTLALTFPAVQRLVGEAFFESAVRVFIEAQPPELPWLDRYGGAFPGFLAGFPPAAGLAYLPGVAQLEWAVNVALHAAGAPALDPAALAGVDPACQGEIAFVPRPSVILVTAGHPVDAIWRAVLDGDDAAMAALDLDEGPVHLLVEREADTIRVIRCAPVAWRFARDLFAGETLARAFAGHDETEATYLLAGHIAAGRFIDFKLEQAP